jgi:siroheme synthase
LIAAGFSANLPCLAVSKVSTADQSGIRTTLGEFQKHTPLESPSVLLVGRVFARALKVPNSNLLTEAARQAVSQATWRILSERGIEP